MTRGEEYLNEYKHPGDDLAALPNDFERYEYCRKEAIKLRNQWASGMRDRVASILDTADARYDNMSTAQRIAQAKVDWFTSLKAKNIYEGEVYWERWARFYLAAWQARSIQTIQRALEALINEVNN